jgi:hypothetical protein
MFITVFTKATWPYPDHPNPGIIDIQKQQNHQMRNASIKERLSTHLLLYILKATKHFSAVPAVNMNYNCTSIPPIRRSQFGAKELNVGSLTFSLSAQQPDLSLYLSFVARSRHVSLQWGI